MKTISTTSGTKTQDFAKELASTFKGGEVVALSGDLGAGKTTFTQGFAEYFNITDHVSSPTFSIINEYSLRQDQGSVKKLVHIDCYRLDTPEELIEIGIQDYFDRDDVVVLIEWAEKVKEILPPKTQWIEFEHSGKENERKIHIH